MARSRRGDALGVVEPVDADQQLLRVRRRRVRISSPIPGSPPSSVQSAASTPMGKTPSRTSRPPPEDAVHLGPGSGRAEYRGREVTHVRRGVEADQVCAEQTLEDALPLGENAEDLRRGERDVEKEPDPCIRDALADQRRHEHQLVVLHPDQIAGAVLGHHRVREALVHPLVVLEVLDLQRKLAREVVEERPEHSVGVRRRSSGGPPRPSAAPGRAASTRAGPRAPGPPPREVGPPGRTSRSTGLRTARVDRGDPSPLRRRSAAPRRRPPPCGP